MTGTVTKIYNKKSNTKANIEKTLIELLETNSFDVLTTLEIASHAGISRSCFYTHFKDKYDILERYLNAKSEIIKDIFEKYQDNKKLPLIKTFYILAEEKFISTLILEKEYSKSYVIIQEHLYKLVYSILSKKKLISRMTSEIEKEYQCICFSNALLGVYKRWICEGKQETPEQITNLLIKLLKII